VTYNKIQYKHVTCYNNYHQKCEENKYATHKGCGNANTAKNSLTKRSSIKKGHMRCGDAQQYTKFPWLYIKSDQCKSDVFRQTSPLTIIVNLMVNIVVTGERKWEKNATVKPDEDYTDLWWLQLKKLDVKGYEYFWICIVRHVRILERE